MDDRSGREQVRKVVVHRRVPALRRPRAARAQRAITGLRRGFTQSEFAPADRLVASWGGSLAPWRLVAVGVIIIMVLTFAWVRLFHIGPPSIEDLRVTAGVDEWKTLPIGVKDDQPGVAERDDKGIWRGFDIDIAYMIAEDLGFRREEVRFYGIESEDRARMEATDSGGRPVPVKMVIASYSITADREREPNVMFTQSYLHTEQSVITLKGHAKVASIEEFAGKTVCSLSASTSAQTADDSGAKITRRNRVSQCFDLLNRDAGVDAVTTDAAILAGYKARDPTRYDHWDLGLDKTEAWGVSVGANAALRDLVNITLYRSFKDPKDARWEQAYDANIVPEIDFNNDADGKFVPVARPQQPSTARPRVRELPWEEVIPVTVAPFARPAKRVRRTQLNWLLTALPAFPLVLLVLRLWYLSRQDLPTMLLLVQYVSPLGMFSALFITLIWTVPAVALVLRALGGLLLVSSPDQEQAARRSLLALMALRMPDWAVAVAVVLAAFTWQLRLLPALLMLVAVIVALTAVQRYPGEHRMQVVVTLVVPIVLGLLVLLWVWPGVRMSLAAGDYGTAALLTAPSLLGWLLTGPVPPRAARLATHWPAVAAVIVAPFVVGVVFLRAPVLPNSAVEVGAAGAGTQVVRGQLITVDDTATTILQRGGEVVFIRNDDVRSKTLCPEPIRTQHSRITVRGWAIDESALEWVAPIRAVTDVDPRCLGRSLQPR